MRFMERIGEYGQTTHALNFSQRDDAETSLRAASQGLVCKNLESSPFN